MSIVFAALAPHPPLLIPTIGKEAIKKIDKTKRALERLEEDLYLARPDIVIIISPHGHWFNDAFSINFCSTYQTDLREFGDLSTKLTFKGEQHLPGEFRSVGKKNNLPTVIISEPRLDHGVTVPLFYLLQHLPSVSIMPIGFCGLDAKKHLDFGYLMKDEILKSTKRIAVVASGDLSHALTTDAPAGFNESGVEFDKKIQELLSAHNTAGLLQINPVLIANAAECGFRSIMILMGILRDINYRYEAYAYEGPFGVGYLTANFVL